MSSRQFWERSDAELNSKGAVMSAVIAAAPLLYGTTEDRATELTSAYTGYNDAYVISQDAARRTKGTVAAKDEKRAILRTILGQISRGIYATPTVTKEMLADISLNIPKHRSTIAAPSQAPAMHLLSMYGRTLTVKIHDLEVEGRNRPPGCVAAWVYFCVGDTYSSDPGTWEFCGSTTRSKYEFTLPNSVANGAQVWVCSTWINAKQQSGPISMPIATNVQGGGASGAGDLKIAA